MSETHRQAADNVVNERPRALDALALRRHPLPAADATGDKEARGHLLIVAGSRETPGAALLACVAALRAGAGKLTLATPQSAAPLLAVAVPEARVIGLPETTDGGPAAEGVALLEEVLERVSAVVVGPGLRDEAACTDFTRKLLAAAPALCFVLDAYAMSAAPGGGLAAEVLLTPHHGEMAHLQRCHKDRIAAEPLQQAREAAQRWKVCVALKGADTFIAAPDGPVWHHHGAQPGLGTSGSGDTLAGLIGGVAARGATLVDAALWGVMLHAMAGAVLAERHGPIGYLARELPDEVPRLMHRLCGTDHAARSD